MSMDMMVLYADEATANMRDKQYTRGTAATANRRNNVMVALQVKMCQWVSIKEMYFSMLTGLILGLRPENERRHYFVTTSLIGWAQA